MLNKIKAWKLNIINIHLPKYCYKSRFLSSLYYIIFSKSFAREHQSVLAGKVKHLKEEKQMKSNYFLVVRNTHRIEKGLLMKPRRNVFAKDYIKETIDNFENIWHLDNKKSNPQITWFQDVLTSYFDACKSDTYISTQSKRFTQIINGEKDRVNCSTLSIPYLRKEADKSSISYQEFFKLCRQRRSVRWFTDEPVPRDLIDKAILAANQSPSACNRQPFEFKVIDDPELVEKVVKIPMGTGGYAHSIKVMVVVVGNLDAYFAERDRHVIYIDGSLASMSFMLALETLGLSSCPINWPDIEDREKRMDKFLRLQAYQRPIMCIGLGYPDSDGMVAFSEKRPLEQIRSYN